MGLKYHIAAQAQIITVQWALVLVVSVRGQVLQRGRVLTDPHLSVWCGFSTGYVVLLGGLFHSPQIAHSWV